MKHILFGAAALVLVASLASAHGSGQSLAKEAGEYQVDVDYNPPDIARGVPVEFAFRLWKGGAGAGELVPFTSVLVRISQEARGEGVDPIIFASNLSRPTLGPAGMTFAFPQAGEYELALRFLNGDRVLAETAFPLRVGQGEAQQWFSWDLAVGAIGGIILGITLGRILFHAR